MTNIDKYRASSIYKASLLQKYFHSLDITRNDLQVRIPILAASLLCLYFSSKGLRASHHVDNSLFTIMDIAVSNFSI